HSELAGDQPHGFARNGCDDALRQIGQHQRVPDFRDLVCDKLSGYFDVCGFLLRAGVSSTNRIDHASARS
ncbi:MAG: hypothetical protein IKR48_07325, partial [Kiritimatiellae bacterium]|nr:hypothetical protein [Kiritimatiellia bacterium]